jgi:hypothetical protein
MSKQERMAIQAFIDSAHLPANSYTLLPRHDGASFRLHVWIDRAFLHAMDAIPTCVRGIPVTLEVRPSVYARQM